MGDDGKQKALADVKRAQAKFDRTKARLSQDSENRRESFKRARETGATLREIAAAAGLHWSSVEESLRKK